MSKRLLFSRVLRRTGLLRCFEMLPSRPGILIINHHRIGDAATTRFDRGVFSQTPEGLSEQVKQVARRMPIVAGEELEALVCGKTKMTRMFAAFTFDDGYLDNYTAALPVLRAHGCPATFFLVTEYVGTAAVPWWDEIAYLIRNTRASSITLQTPQTITVTLSADREHAIDTLLRQYKRQDNVQGEAFLAELREQADCAIPFVQRRFLSWEEARVMQSAGMEIGSHTCSHPILGQLTPELQWSELQNSKAELESQVGAPVRSLAFPVGIAGSFTPATQDLARKAGYAMAFAFAGGINLSARLQPMHLRRLSMPADSLSLRTDLGLLMAAGRLPY